MLVRGKRVPSEPPTAAGQILLGPTKQTEEREIKKNFLFGGKKDNAEREEQL